MRASSSPKSPPSDECGLSPARAIVPDGRPMESRHFAAVSMEWTTSSVFSVSMARRNER
ncbi:MAG: hypothetical protein BWY99_02741 [Synergistetes bacterium ADurb.BinA166]|nr:MAG: hypothetical protein BWY99_02741 [Synergistetes bacterium ADurb.BinA166]